MAVVEVTTITADESGIAHVVLNRSASGNSLNPNIAREIAKAIGLVTQGARCIILRSEGRIFCSGADIAFLESLLELGRDEIRDSIYLNFQAMIRAVVECPVPVIAMLQGAAVGAGCDLALACDLIVAGESGWLEESWIKIGATSALAGAFHLMESIGARKALEALVTSRRLNAKECLDMGLFTRVVRDDDLLNETKNVALAIADRDSDAVRSMKQLVRDAQHDGFERALAIGRELQADLLSRPQFARQVEELRMRLEATAHA
jgi:2-(1,2-epoxy-1,2-dihydrophenyl)acetyl-CoA isomerase